MANLQKEFLTFHENIKIGTYEGKYANNTLREKRDLIINKLKEKLKAKVEEGYPQFVKSFNQGSYALNTGIKPIDGDYDIDVGVLLDCYIEDYKPVDLKDLVAECIEHTNRTVNVSRSCVTITYIKDGEPDYHVDLPIYAKSSDESDDTYYLAKGRKNLKEEDRFWQESDPEGLTDLINGLYKDDENYELEGKTQRKQFRRCVRYLKRWRNHKNVYLHSIALTIATYHWLEPDVDEQNDNQVMLSLVEAILDNFNWSGRLKIELPVTPKGDLLESVDDDAMTKLKEHFETLRDNLQSAIDNPDAHEASKALRKSFGDDFPEVAKNENAKKEESYVNTGTSA